MCRAANRDSRLESARVTVGDAPGAAVPGWSGIDLKAGEMRCARVPVTFPGSLAAGSRAWVRLDADVEGKSVSSWAVLTVVPAFEFAMRDVEPGWFALDVRGNLSKSSEPEMHLQVAPSESGFGISKKQAKGETVYSITPPGNPGVKAELVMRARLGDFWSERKYPLASVEEHPVVRQIIAGEGMMWGYAYRGREEHSGGAEGATAHTGAVCRVEELTSGGVSKHSLFMHPPYIGGVGYTYCVTGPIALPDKGCEFRGSIGLRDGGIESDGVVFSIFVIDETGASHEILKRHWKERKWKEVSADLSQFRGKTIRLRFVADVGPNDNSTADWASWGDPRIVEKASVIRAIIEH